MKKRKIHKKQQVNENRKRKISRNFLGSYLLILLAPAVAVLAIYCTAKDAMVETQKERIQSLVTEVGNAFDREVKEAQNVGYYVGKEKRLSSYLMKMRSQSREQEFYSLYTIADSYPNYTLTNEVIKNVFVLISDSQYVMKIPQVIPENERGFATLEDFPFGSYEDFMNYYSEQDQSQSVFYYEDENGKATLLIPGKVTYPSPSSKCAVVVQLDWQRITKLLRPILAGEDGVAALVDADGQILACSENSGTRDKVFYGGKNGDLETYLKENSWKKNSLVTCCTGLSYNGWQIIAAVPKSVLTSQIGTTRYVTVALCFVSVFIGMIVCLAYWYQRKGMVQEFFDLKERIVQGRPIQKEQLQFWRSFDSFLTEVDQLQNTVEQQENMLRESFLGKMLYGSYDSEKQLETEAKKAGFPLEKGFYYVVDMEFEDPLRGGSSVSREEFSAILDKLLAEHITWNCWRYSVSELSMVLLIRSAEELPAEELKKALEEMNYEFYSCLKVQSYTGISNAVKEPLEIARQYEIASRISEFARYRGIRVPVLPEELPREQMLDQPLFVTIDMELKLVKQIQNGSAEQLEELIDQIKKVYFRPGNSQYTYRHTIEILRSCLFRSIPAETEDPEVLRLREAAQKVYLEEPLFDLLRETRALCASLQEKKEEAAVNLDREKISGYIEENLGNACLNLSILAEWLEEPERKLYNDFKLCFGMSFSSYLEQRRMARACELLKDGVAVKETAEKVGYCSDYSFRRAFKRVVGIPPSDFRKMQTV
ncbi:MAG: AraC family transcriptional regulator [Blautia sp.]|nr:AraC family transcriptional regulator [Blautia sp.]MDY2896494.1 AraC family transcriptional regulator [Candidatus Limivivens sp.]